MAIQYPANRKEVVDRVKTDIKTELPQTEPFIRNSMLSSLATGFGGAAYDIYKTEQQLEKQMFPDTATGSYAARWGNLKNITPKVATQANGYITVTGVDGSNIPANSELKTVDNLSYFVIDDISISTTTINIISLIRSGSTVTAETSVNHNYANGNLVTISGADQSQYNGSFIITATSNTKFTYTITGTPITPATGIITSTNTFANVNVTSINSLDSTVGYGSKYNQSAGASMTFVSPIAGVNSVAFVNQNGIGGGSDSETDTEFKNRYIYAYQNPVSFFNVSQLTALILNVPNIARVFIFPITPDVGQVTIYIMVGDGSITPSVTDINNVRAAIDEELPCDRSDNDVFILAPTLLTQIFTLSSLDPDTPTMRSAIDNNLRQYFLEQTQVGVDITTTEYKSIIQSSIDLSTGQQVKTFILSTPTSDIIVPAGNLAVYGGGII